MDSFTSTQTKQAAEPLRQLGRAVQFSAKLALALQTDYAPLWRAKPGAVQGLTAAQAAWAEGFRAMLGDFQAVIARAEAGLGASPTPGSPEAVALLARFSPEGLGERTRAIQALARQIAASPILAAYVAAAVRTPPPRPAARGQTGRMGPPTATGRLPAHGAALGTWLQRALGPVAGELLGPAPRPQVSPLKQAFHRARNLVGKVLARSTFELELVAVSLEGVRLPGQGRPVDEIHDALDRGATAAALDPAQRSWLVPVAKRLLVDPFAVKHAAVAVNNFLHAQALHREAQALAPRVNAAPSEGVAGVLGRFELAKYRASIMPLAHLHVTFKDTPVFQLLFPAPREVAPP